MIEINLTITKTEVNLAIKRNKQKVNITLNQSGIFLTKMQYVYIVRALKELGVIIGKGGKFGNDASFYVNKFKETKDTNKWIEKSRDRVIKRLEDEIRLIQSGRVNLSDYEDFIIPKR